MLQSHPALSCVYIPEDCKPLGSSLWESGARDANEKLFIYVKYTQLFGWVM